MWERKKKCSLVFCCAEHEGVGIQNASVWSGCLNSEWSYRHRNSGSAHTHTRIYSFHPLSLSHTSHTNSFLIFRCKGQNQNRSQNWGNYVLFYLWIDLLLQNMILDCLSRVRLPMFEHLIINAHNSPQLETWHSMPCRKLLHKGCQHTLEMLESELYMHTLLWKH